MKKILTILSVALLAVTACQKAVEVIDQTGVSLDQSAKTMSPGEIFDLSATISPANATSNYLTWKSSDTKIAAVTNHGAVTAVGPDYKAMGPGKATITATTVDGKVSAKCEITVNPIKVTGVTLDAVAEVYEFEEITLKAVVAPANASYKDSLKWESADPTIATVKDGVVKGIKAGKTNVTVTALDGSKTATCNVTVQLSKNLKLWVDDAAGTAALDGGKAEVSSDWLKYKDGVVSWDENKTGKIRTATIVIAESHASATITQISPADFGSEWTLYSKLFDANERMGGSKGNCTTKVEIKVAEGENGNNITIGNLYPEMTVEGKLDIDYKAMKVKVGVYCSHKIYKSKVGYCVLLPECATAAAGSYWGGYEFCPKNDKQFSDTNYDWLWFDFNEELNTAKYQYYGAGQLSANGKYRYCGLSFVIASKTAITGTAYDLIHQANFNGDNAESMYFKR